MNKDDIINIIRQLKPGLSKYGIRRIGLFGSFIRNQQNGNSDIDILIDLDKDSNLTLFELIDIEELLETKFNRKIDLSLFSTLKPQISKSILNEVVYI